MSVLDSRDRFASIHCIVERDAGELLVMLPGSSEVVIIKGSGILLWNELQEPTTISALVQLLLSKYCISEETATADVKQFIQSCMEHKIIKKAR